MAKKNTSKTTSNELTQSKARQIEKVTGLALGIAMKGREIDETIKAWAKDMATKLLSVVEEEDMAVTMLAKGIAQKFVSGVIEQRQQNLLGFINRNPNHSTKQIVTLMGRQGTAIDYATCNNDLRALQKVGRVQVQDHMWNVKA